MTENKTRWGKGNASLKKAFGILPTGDGADKKPLGELP
jgi:hypothetical protein